ncbi:MAG: nucleoside 2-deoxyribosyltransferase domain-containing protein [Deltaproteobacteria bacterium]|nr:nucleoside 2-deoxyribosyltransferase domain-containing protein [Deltaproteobacteria bacterium]
MPWTAGSPEGARHADHRRPSAITGPRPWVFLAGCVKDGLDGPWRRQVAEAVADRPGTLLDPERPDWDSSWRESIEDARFAEQVRWELSAQERADLVVMYFGAVSEAPISLLELGLFAPRADGSRRGGELVVVCTEDYRRRGNVEVVCDRYGVPLLSSLDALVERIRGL